MALRAGVQAGAIPNAPLLTTEGEIARLLKGPEVVGPVSYDPSEDTIRPLEFTPGQQILNIIGGAAVGVAKGVFPDERIQGPPGQASDVAEFATRLPTALVANVLGLGLTGGAYNVAAGGVQAMTANEVAQDTAIRQGDFEALRRLQQAQASGTVANAALSGLTSLIPGALGTSLTKQVLSGAGLGYGQDLLAQTTQRYATTGRVDNVDFTPGAGTALGAGLPVAMRYGPQAVSMARRAIQQQISAAMQQAEKGRVLLRGRAYGRVLTGIPKRKLPLRGSYSGQEYTPQFAGDLTDATATRFEVSRMQQDANRAVNTAFKNGDTTLPWQWIEAFEKSGDSTKAMAIRMAMMQPEIQAQLHPVMQRELLETTMPLASEAGRALRQLQENPMYQFVLKKNEYIEAMLKDSDAESAGQVGVTQEIGQLIEESFVDLYNILRDTFADTLAWWANAAKPVGGTKRFAQKTKKRTLKTKERPQPKARELKLKLVQVNEAREREKLAQKAANDAAKALEKLQQQALAEIRNLEKQGYVQTKLPLKVKTQVRAVTEQALNTLSPQMRAYYNDLVRRRNAAMLLRKLDARLRPVTNGGAGESVEMLFERLKPFMSQAQIEDYGTRILERSKQRFLKKLMRDRAPATRKTILQRLMEAHGHGLLNASSPEVLPRILRNTREAGVTMTKDYAEFTRLLEIASDISVPYRERRAAEITIERFLMDRRDHSAWAKYFDFRRAFGFLLQVPTQARNLIDATAVFPMQKLLLRPWQELAEAAYEQVAGNRFDKNLPVVGPVFRISKAVEAYYEKTDLTFRDELEGIGKDLKTGENSARTYTADVFQPGSVTPTIFHRKAGRAPEWYAQAEKTLGGFARLASSIGDRTASALYYEQEMKSLLEKYYRTFKALPEEGSEMHMRLRAVALQRAKVNTMVNEGIVSDSLTGIRRGISTGVDKIVTKATGRKGPSAQAGTLFLPFTRVVGNLATRWLEFTPVGPLGVYFNRAFFARAAASDPLTGASVKLDFQNEPLLQTQAFGDVAASALLAGLATGALESKLFYDMGYYGGFAVNPPDDPKNLRRAKEDAGKGGGVLNVTGLYRYLTEGGKGEAFLRQPDDVTINLRGTNSPGKALIYVTTPGYKDRAARNAYSPDTPEIGADLIAGIVNASVNDDALSGILRLPNKLRTAVNPETGEKDLLAAGATLAGELTSLKFPLSDTLLPEIKEPLTLDEMAIAQNVLFNRGLKSVVNAAGEDTVRQGIIETGENLEPFSKKLVALAENTGETKHLPGQVPKTIEDDVTGEKITLSKTQRRDLDKGVKLNYVSILEEELFPLELNVDPQLVNIDMLAVDVAAKIKNDILNALLIRGGLKKELPRVRKGKVSQARKPSGASLLLRRSAPNGAALYKQRVAEYVTAAYQKQVDDALTKKLREAVVE